MPTVLTNTIYSHYLQPLFTTTIYNHYLQLVTAGMHNSYGVVPKVISVV